MKKLLSVLLCLAMLFGFAGCAGGGGGGGGGEDLPPLNVPDGKPTYIDDEQMTFYAYAGPRGGGYRWKVNGQVHPDDPAGGWNSFITEKDFLDYKNAGFNLLYPENDASYDVNS